MQIVAVTDPLQLGFSRQAMVGVRADGDLASVADKLAALPEVDYVVVTAGSFDLLVEVVCNDDDAPAVAAQRLDPRRSRGPRLRDLRLSQAHQTDLHLGYPMSNTAAIDRPTHLQAGRPAPPLDALHPHVHLRRPRHPDHRTRRGPYVWDSHGKRYLDGLSGLFVVQAGHGRQELADAAAKQAAELGYFPLWSYAHPSAIQLAERLASYAPGDINRVFFTTGGGEAVESAWKLARQYFRRPASPAATR